MHEASAHHSTKSDGHVGRYTEACKPPETHHPIHDLDPRTKRSSSVLPPLLPERLRMIPQLRLRLRLCLRPRLRLRLRLHLHERLRLHVCGGATLQNGAGCTTLTADVSSWRVLNGAGCTTLTADVAKADVKPGRSPNAATTLSIALSLKFAMMSACSFAFLASQ